MKDPLVVAEKRIAKLEKGLEAIRDYEPREIVKDAFAYDRMVEAYREAARDTLEERTVKRTYIHHVWFTDNNEPFEGSPIRGKAAFKRIVLAYYQGDGDREIAFHLEGSTRVYTVIPRINHLGNLGLYYTCSDPKCTSSTSDV